jgi:DNA-binding transcriptional MerR regulator
MIYSIVYSGGGWGVNRGFAAGAAARLSGVSYRTLDFWAKTGFIVPSIVQSAGKGSDRVYSFQDVVALRVANRLRTAGISLQKLRRVTRYLQERDELESPLVETYLISDGIDVFEQHSDEVRSLLQRPGQTTFAWVLDLRSVVDEVRMLMTA